MKALAQSIETFPESYQDDSFDIVVRDTRSVAIFWDLAEESRPVHENARLSLRVYSELKNEADTLILNHEAGHMIVPLSENARSYQLQLGWADVNGFEAIATDDVVLPPLPKSNFDDAKAGKSIFFPPVGKAGRSGFRPAAEL